MNTYETVRKLSTLDKLSEFDEKHWALFGSAGKIGKMAPAQNVPPVSLRASYDVHSQWHSVTRSA